MEDSIDWISISKLQVVLLCPHLQRVAVNFCLVLSLEGKYILHSSIIAYMQQILPRFLCAKLKLFVFEEN